MKKWMATLDNDQYEWIKLTAKETGTKGSVVLREAVNHLRTIDTGDFKLKLRNTQIEDKLNALERQKARIEAEERKLKHQIKEKAIA